MSANSLTTDGEFRYIIQWFDEWSELQREDFIPILIEYIGKDAESAVGDGGGYVEHMSGVISALTNTSLEHRPMSLFQCRIKLFKQWSSKWPEDFKYKLKEKIYEMDPKLGEKIIQDLQYTNINEKELISGTVTAVNVEIITAIADTLKIETDSNLVAELVQEATVDDITACCEEGGCNDGSSNCNNTNKHYTVTAEPITPLPHVIVEQPVEQVDDNAASVIATAMPTIGNNAVEVSTVS